MEKEGYLNKNILALPVVAAVLFSSTVLVPVSAAPIQTLQLPSVQSGAGKPLESESIAPFASLMEEKLLINCTLKEIKAEQEKLQQEEAARQEARLRQESEARQKAMQEASKLKAAKVRAPKTVSRNMTLPTAGFSYAEMINYSLSFQGIPYKYGSTDPAVGLDCSAFTQIVFHHFNVDLPRTAAQQFRVGIGIAQAELQIGDLVFFSTNGPGASHVGIYVGEGKFISTTTKGVTIQDMNDNYWGKYYIGSRRVYK